MADKIPVKAIFTGSDATALGEFNLGDTIGLEHGGTGATTAPTARNALGLGTAALADSASFATSTQGAKADSALQPNDNAAVLGSGTATVGKVLGADGSGGADWITVAAGGSAAWGQITGNIADQTDLASAYVAVDSNASLDSLTIDCNSATDPTLWAIQRGAGPLVRFGHDAATYANITFDAAGFMGVASGLCEPPVTANTSTAYTIGARSLYNLTLTGTPVVFTFPTATAGRQFTLLLKQDGTGTRLVTWPASVRWATGTAPTLTTTAAKTDVVSFLADGTYWLGFVGGLNYTRA